MLNNASRSNPAVRRSRARRGVQLLLLTLFLAAALFTRVYRLDSVPPGVHYDEILNGEIAEEALQRGPQFFYDHSGGREGLYHLLLTATFALPLPVTWQLRLPSILFSMLGLLFSYLWAARAFGRWAALTTLGLMAVSFWTVWMGRAALRVGTVTPVAAIAAFLLVSLLRQEVQQRSAWLPVSLGLGVVLGLSFYTYRAGSMVFVLFLAFAGYLFLWHREHVRKLAPSLVVALIVALPIIVLFVTQPEADPRFGQIALPWQALWSGDPMPALQGLLDNLGMFFWRGDMEGHYNLPGRPHFEPLGALLFLAGLGVAFWRWRQPLYAFCLLWLFVGLLPGIFTLPAPSFVHTVGAQGVTYVFPGIALATLQRKIAGTGQTRAAALAPALIVLLVAVNAAWTYADYFHRWPEVHEVRGFHQADLALIAADLERRETSDEVAICSSVLNEEDSFWRSGRQSIRFMMDREDLDIRWYDCGFAQVLPRTEAEALLYFPNGTGFADWLTPLQDEGSVTERAALDGDVKRVHVDVARWREALLADLVPAPDVEAPVQFGSDMAFLGYRLSRVAAEPGEEISLMTVWEVSASLAADLSVFVHLMDEAGTLVAQGDAFTVLSDTLSPGDVVVQLHHIRLPTDAAPGKYPLSIGVYSRSGDSPPRPVVVAGQAGDARLLLDAIELLAP